MKPIGTDNYFIYILTNKYKTVLYTGVTNDILTRLEQYKKDAMGNKKTFAGQYNCIHLIYYERYEGIQHAIEREKEIKGWARKKKENFISSFNPKWVFLESKLD